MTREDLEQKKAVILDELLIWAHGRLDPGEMLVADINLRVQREGEVPPAYAVAEKQEGPITEETWQRILAITPLDRRALAIIQEFRQNSNAPICFRNLTRWPWSWVEILNRCLRKNGIPVQFMSVMRDQQGPYFQLCNVTYVPRRKKA